SPALRRTEAGKARIFHKSRSANGGGPSHEISSWWPPGPKLTTLRKGRAPNSYRLDRFGDDQTGRARQRRFFNLIPSGLSEPCVGFLLAIGLSLARDDEELSRYQRCRTRLRVTRIGPQIDEQQPCTGLHTCPHLAQQFDVMRYREDMGGVCDD